MIGADRPTCGQTFVEAIPVAAREGLLGKHMGLQGRGSVDGVVFGERFWLVRLARDLGVACGQNSPGLLLKQLLQLQQLLLPLC